MSRFLSPWSRRSGWSHGRRFATARRVVQPYAGATLLDYGCGDGTFLGLVRDQVLAALFGAGSFLYGQMSQALVWLAVFVVTGALLSLVAMLLGGTAFQRIAAGEWPYWTLAAALALLGPAQALVMTSTQVLTMHDVPLRAAGAAGGVSQTAQRVMTAIGLAAVTAAFYAALGVRGNGAQPDQLAYGEAAVAAVVVVAGFLSVTLLAGTVDLLRRRRNGTLSLQDDSPAG